jgi:pyruvate formate lyase activating enzyme
MRVSEVKTEDLKEAELWKPEAEGAVRCFMCEHRCKIKPDRRGFCEVRLNRDGVLYSMNYGRLISANVDPIEKKPLFHFHPGTRSLSIATVGCNLRCVYCQNCSISQWPVEHPDRMLPGEVVAPEEVVAMAKARRCATIAHTYTEPTIFLEYARDVAKLCEPEGIKNVFVTNGYMTPEALDMMDGWLHAANVDIKTKDDEVMRKLTKAHSEPVLENIRRMRERGVWVEATTLIVPGYNDTDEHLRSVAEFLVEVDADIPWHLSRFHPSYKLLDVPSTPTATLAKACKIAREAGLRYVYTGNVWGDENESTTCPSCGKVVMRRFGFAVEEMSIESGKCVHCGHRIAGQGLP